MMLIDSDCIASKWNADYRMHLLVERGKECGKQMRKHDFDEKTFFFSLVIFRLTVARYVRNVVK